MTRQLSQSTERTERDPQALMYLGLKNIQCIDRNLTKLRSCSDSLKYEINTPKTILIKAISQTGEISTINHHIIRNGKHDGN